MSFRNLTNNTQITANSATARQAVVTPSTDTLIGKCTIKNDNASTAYSVYFYIVSNTTTTGTVIEQHIEASIAADSTADVTEIVGHVIPAGGSLQVHSTTATDTYITVSGL